MVDPKQIALDPERLATLDAYAILDTPPERGFDDAVTIAAEALHAPIALVSLVAADRQWFKARVGLEACETPLDQSVCAHVLETGDLLVVPDLTADPRTRDNPLVTGEPFMRFYAGACLVAPNGQPLGTLCVIDVVPRPDGLSSGEESLLRALARQVVDTLELRRLVAERSAMIIEQGREHDSMVEVVSSARYRELSLRSAVEATGLGVFDCEATSGAMTCDLRARDLLGLEFEATASFEDAVLPSVHAADREQVADAFKASLDPGGPRTFDSVFRVGGSEREPRWVDAQGRLIVIDGRAAHLIGTVRDVSARFRADERQHLLNRELSHRMKNVLAMVQAIAAQTLRSASDLDQARDALFSRLIAFSRAHDMLLSDAAKGASLKAVVTEAVQIHIGREDSFEVSGPELPVSAKNVLPIVLLLHELSTNAVKYGALSGEAGQVSIGWTIVDAPSGPAARIEWRERGGPLVTPPARQGFGTRLIERGIAAQLGAAIALDYRPEGLRCTLEAPVATLQQDD